MVGIVFGFVAPGDLVVLGGGGGMFGERAQTDSLTSTLSPGLMFELFNPMYPLK